jgi:hypothetical protein
MRARNRFSAAAPIVSVLQAPYPPVCPQLAPMAITPPYCVDEVELISLKSLLEEDDYDPPPIET